MPIVASQTPVVKKETTINSMGNQSKIILIFLNVI